MRPIKFRAWDKTQKVMIYPDSDLLETHYRGIFPPSGMEVEITLEGYAYINQQYPYENTSYLDNELELLQFTGLCDKNGADIYEGDIIEWDAEEWGAPHREIVEWNFDLLSARQNEWRQYGKVIGNIYENPELCKEASE